MILGNGVGSDSTEVEMFTEKVNVLKLHCQALWQHHDGQLCSLHVKKLMRMWSDYNMFTVTILIYGSLENGGDSHLKNQYAYCLSATHYIYSFSE